MGASRLGACHHIPVVHLVHEQEAPGLTVPSEVLDYCLMHMLANISVAFSTESCERKKMVNEMTDGYAGAETAKQWLDQVMMSV